MLETTTVFEGGTAECAAYRIPGLVVTAAGSLLAYCEARRSLEFGDWADIDIVLRRSEDNGRSWSASRCLADNGVRTCNNPVAIASRRSGEVHLFYCRDYERLYYRRSEDDGRTFTDEVDATGVVQGFQSRKPWNVVATGPGHGVELRNGRLVVPIWLGWGEPVGNGNPVARRHSRTVASVIYSDDRGRTWQRGEIVSESDGLCTANESAVAELGDGRVMINMRRRSDRWRRVVSISPDGIGDWSAPRYDEELFEPVCMAGLARLDEPGEPAPVLVFTNPDSRELPRRQQPGRPANGQRANLTVRASYDDGVSWQGRRVLDPGQSGYSDLATDPQGTIYCLYEQGRSTDGQGRAYVQRLALATFDLAWLRAGVPAAATT